MKSAFCVYEAPVSFTQGTAAHMGFPLVVVNPDLIDVVAGCPSVREVGILKSQPSEEQELERETRFDGFVPGPGTESVILRVEAQHGCVLHEVWEEVRQTLRQYAAENDIPHDQNYEVLLDVHNAFIVARNEAAQKGSNLTIPQQKPLGSTGASRHGGKRRNPNRRSIT
jgi:hypothetical protein